MVGREAFVMKPMHQCHLSQWGEWVYDSQSWKDRRLLRESMINKIDKQTLIIKKRWEEKLFLWNQSINVIYPNEENEFMIHNHAKKGDYYVNLCLSKLTNEFWF